jgi:predicted porin
MRGAKLFRFISLATDLRAWTLAVATPEIHNSMVEQRLKALPAQQQETATSGSLTFFIPDFGKNTMKSTLGAIALAALAGPVFAQSSVTMYGVVDLDGQYIDGASKALRVTSGGLNGSRIGFKGTEDLGSGNFVDFVLEGGINVDTGSSGQGGALFGRQAFGALRSTTLGTLSAGRQYSSLYVLSNDFSAFSNTPVGPSTAVIGGYAGGYEPIQGGSGTATAVTNATGESLNGGPARVNNSVRYTTPSFAGFKASVLAGAGEVTGGATKTRLFDGSVRYTANGLDLSLAVISDKAAGATAATSANVTTYIAGASYTFDAFVVEGGYLKGDDKRAIASTALHDGRAFWLGGSFRSGQSLFKAQWVNNQVDNNAVGATDSKVNAFGLGYQYDFSKRTALYSSIAHFANKGDGVGRFNSSISGLTTATDKNINEFALGIRHSF